MAWHVRAWHGVACAGMAGVRTVVVRPGAGPKQRPEHSSSPGEAKRLMPVYTGTLGHGHAPQQSKPVVGVMTWRVTQQKQGAQPSPAYHVPS